MKHLYRKFTRANRVIRSPERFGCSHSTRSAVRCITSRLLVRPALGSAFECGVDDPCWGQRAVGCSAGAVRLEKCSRVDLSQTQWGRKPHVEFKDKCLSDRTLPHCVRARKSGLTISSRCQVSASRVSEKLPQG